jgi:hypothetical protein
MKICVVYSFPLKVNGKVTGRNVVCKDPSDDWPRTPLVRLVIGPQIEIAGTDGTPDASSKDCGIDSIAMNPLKQPGLRTVEEGKGRTDDCHGNQAMLSENLCQKSDRVTLNFHLNSGRTAGANWAAGLPGLNLLS